MKPSNFIAGRPKAAVLVWFFGDLDVVWFFCVFFLFVCFFCCFLLLFLLAIK